MSRYAPRSVGVGSDGGEPGGESRRPTWVRSADTVRVPCALLVAAAVLAVAAPAHASCAEAPPTRPPLTSSDHVFAGSITRTTHGGAAAEVEVTDVWHGPDLPPRVVVVGGQLAGGRLVDRPEASGRVSSTPSSSPGPTTDRCATAPAPRPRP